MVNVMVWSFVSYTRLKPLFLSCLFWCGWNRDNTPYVLMEFLSLVILLNQCPFPAPSLSLSVQGKSSYASKRFCLQTIGQRDCAKHIICFFHSYPSRKLLFLSVTILTLRICGMTVYGGCWTSPFFFQRVACGKIWGCSDKHLVPYFLKSWRDLKRFPSQFLQVPCP